VRTAAIALVSTVLGITSAHAQSEAWRVRGVSSLPGVGGLSVAWLADLNGDGVADYVAGGPSLTGGPGLPGTPGSGRALICSGADGSILFDLFGGVGAAFGFAVARAGDIDGDGVEDVAVGAPLEGNGAVYFFSGATGTQLRKLSGPSAGCQFGTSIADLGDVDGDGVRDLAIGAPLDSSSGSNLGLAEVVSGATGSVIAQWTGAAAGGEFGSVVADAGDLDGDGRDDVLVIEQDVTGSGNLSICSSATFLQLASWNLGAHPTGWTARGAGDVNGDGIPDVIVGNGTWPTTGYFTQGAVWIYDGATGGVIRTHQGFVFGATTVCGAGDVDRDGFADYAFWWLTSNGVSAPAYVSIISGQTGKTLADVLAGSQDSEATVGGSNDTNGDGVPDLLIGVWNPSVLHVLDPVTLTFLTTSDFTPRVDALGWTSALLDDVNGDGTRDVLVGELSPPSYYPGSAGHARVLSGVDGSELRDHSTASGALYAYCVAALPDLDGDGIAEYAIPVSDTYKTPGFVEIRSGASGNLLKSLSSGINYGGSFGWSCTVAIQPSGGVELAVGCPGYNLTKGAAVVFDVATGNVVVSVASTIAEEFGKTISYLGDVDGDGVGDWVAGAPSYKWPQGEVVVFSGKTGNTIHALQGGGGSLFGAATCGPGDLDGDGIPDLMVGEPYLNRSNGGAELYSGANWSLLRSWNGTGPALWFGSSLTVVGDVNRDRFNDVLIGNALNGSHASLYSGASGGLLYRFDGALKDDSFGATAAGVAAPGSVGSMNGDAIPDVAIGGYTDTTNGYDAGRLSLCFLDDFYLQIDPTNATAGQTVSLTSSGGPAGNLTGLFVTAFDSTPLFLLTGLGNLDPQGIWAISGVVPTGLAGHTITLMSITAGFTGKLAITQPMMLTLQ
jgi:VCBS repeat protein/FG-GAP repeat protein